MAGPGRETKFDEERAESILKDLADGSTRECAAERAGIGERTLRRWVSRGKAGEDPFVAFLAAIKKAERGKEHESVKSLLAIAQGGQLIERRIITKRDGTDEVIEKFSQGQWTALAWWLERKFPEYWGKDSETIREMIAEHKKRKADNG